ncbi:hypothetical protein Micbo1qcDRAFT_206204 [Microdochium bolleyi]|uniref:BTB domain-containing protein n=1 Tax=Microdochium bolleyi TaxID=196109 RepID=A0A136IYG0_9PEZI|nr:hypothetical protein Micbo1qcDRAFT_206204 [Microdochium bolleyi]
METVTIDSRGDFWMHVSGSGSLQENTPTKCQVCSRTLARCSDVFAAMLRGGFAESHRDEAGQWNVTLYGDAAPAMQRMHCRFDEVEELVTDPCDEWEELELMPNVGMFEPHEGSTALTLISRLCDLVVVADKYNSMKLLRPWATKAVRAIRKAQCHATNGLRRACLLYHLGDRRGYENIATLLVNYQLDQDTTSSILLLPVRMLDNIHTACMKIIENALDSVKHCLEDLLLSTPASTRQNCVARSSARGAVSEQEKVDCEARLLGQMIRGLHQHQLWPIPPASEVTRLHNLTIDLAFRSSCFSKRIYVADDDEVAYMERQRTVTGVVVW